MRGIGFLKARRLWRLAACVAGLAVAAGQASAANYEFLAAPHTDLNRVYRLDRATGEVGACQYGLKDC